MTEIHDLVIPETEAPITAGVILRRFPDGIETNIPHHCIEHSPSGYEWGYFGSGPADLALNIAESALLTLGHTGPRQDCYQGSCYRAAWEIHQSIKYQFLATVPLEGGVIYWPALRAWVIDRLIESSICPRCGDLQIIPWQTAICSGCGWESTL